VLVGDCVGVALRLGVVVGESETVAVPLADAPRLTDAVSVGVGEPERGGGLEPLAVPLSDAVLVAEGRPRASL
jgi:hypothetical protein